MASRSARVDPPDGWGTELMLEGGDRGRFVGGEHPGGGGGVGRHLLWPGGTGDDRRHRGLGQEPGDGQLADGAAVFGGERLVGLDTVEVLVGGGGGEAIAAGQAGSRRERFPPAVLAGEE